MLPPPSASAFQRASASGAGTTFPARRCSGICQIAFSSGTKRRRTKPWRCITSPPGASSYPARSASIDGSTGSPRDPAKSFAGPQACPSIVPTCCMSARRWCGRARRRRNSWSGGSGTCARARIRFCETPRSSCGHTPGACRNGTTSISRASRTSRSPDASGQPAPAPRTRSMTIREQSISMRSITAPPSSASIRQHSSRRELSACRSTRSWPTNFRGRRRERFTSAT